MTESHENSTPEDAEISRAKTHELRELMACLSDEGLTDEQASRLNALLKEDPIAQEQYLDHMLVDGLLQFEFGQMVSEHTPQSSSQEAQKDGLFNGKRGGRPEWRSSQTRLVVSLIGLLLLGVATGWLYLFNVIESTRVGSLPLVNPGFEAGAILLGVANLDGVWYGDSVEIVRVHSGVSPLEGEQMVRFVKSEFEPNNSCELYQLVDLAPMASEIAEGQVTVDAYAFFNTAPHSERQAGYIFGITLYAYAARPEQVDVWPLKEKRQVSLAGGQQPADRDLATWQQVEARLALPADTTHLLVQVSVAHTGEQQEKEQAIFADHFLDHVNLQMVNR